VFIAQAKVVPSSPGLSELAHVRPKTVVSVFAMRALKEAMSSALYAAFGVGTLALTDFGGQGG
jgi:hypothetical protein